MAQRFSGLPVASVVGLWLPVATTRRSRLVGLAQLPADEAGPGLLLPGCRSVHTFGMRFPIDVLFLDGAGQVLERHEGVGPRRILTNRRASAVAEIPTVAGGEGVAAGP